MNTRTNRLPTHADLAAIAPALRAIAATTPFAFARVRISESGDPEVNIQLPVPANTNPVEVTAHVAYGSVWEVKASGFSWSLASADDLRTTAAVLGVAQNLVALLASLSAAR